MPSLDALPALSSLLPVVMGGCLIARFKDWAYTEEAVREKLDLARTTIDDQIARAHYDVLEYQNFTKGNWVKDEQTEGTDFVLRLAKTVRKRCSVLLRMELAEMQTKGGYNVILFTVFIGIGLLMTAAIGPAIQQFEIGYYLLIVAANLIAIQCFVLVWLRKVKSVVDNAIDSL